jgi:hypothetical protein
MLESLQLVSQFHYVQKSGENSQARLTSPNMEAGRLLGSPGQSKPWYAFGNNHAIRSQIAPQSSSMNCVTNAC